MDAFFDVFSLMSDFFFEVYCAVEIHLGSDMTTAGGIIGAAFLVGLLFKLLGGLAK